MRKANSLLIALFVVVSGFTLYKTQKAETFTVSATESELHWYAKKVTGKHDGTVALKSGELQIDGKKLTGGSFEIDMTTIAVTDIPATEKSNANLVGHLKNADFFDVEKFPAANLKIKSVKKTGKMSKTDNASEFNVTGDLTIKGKTNPVVFAAYLKVDGSNAEARTTITFDRSKYDVKYGSKSFFPSIGDKMIYDEVDMKIILKAKK
jgi:polyisoprenoid-binding protein YceI